MALFACVLIGANASVKCDVCKRVAGYAYQKIEHRGCGIVTKLEGGSMCEIVGFGPEDPMADVCVAVVWKGCDYLMKEIEKGFFLPQHLCQHWCGADSSSSGWRRLKWRNKFKKKAKRVWRKGKKVWKKGKKVYEKVKPVVQWINAVRDAKANENRYGNARRLPVYNPTCWKKCGEVPDCGEQYQKYRYCNRKESHWSNCVFMRCGSQKLIKELREAKHKESRERREKEWRENQNMPNFIHWGPLNYEFRRLTHRHHRKPYGPWHGIGNRDEDDFLGDCYDSDWVLHSYCNGCGNDVSGRCSRR